MKNCVSVTLKILSIWCSIPIETFFSCYSKQLLDSSILILFSASAVFCFTSSISLFHQQNISLWGLFSSGETNKSHSGWEWVNREGGPWGSVPFLVKNYRTHSGVRAGALINYPSWNGQMCWKSLQKKFIEAEFSLSQQHQLVHWYRWVPGTLT